MNPLRAALHRWRWPLGLMALLLLSWSLLLPLAFEPMLRWGLTRATAGWGGHTLQFEAARWRPWALAAEIDGLTLRTPQGATLAGVQRLGLDVSLASLPKRALVLDALQLQAPRAALRLDAQGHDWAPLLRALQGDAPPAADPQQPPRLRIEQLRVQGAALQFSDARTQPARNLGLDAIDLALDALSTLPEDRGTHTLSARSSQGARLAWRGHFSLTPLQAQGELELHELALPQLFAHLPWPLRSPPPQGQLGLSLRYAVEGREAGAAPHWRIEQGRLQVDGLALRASAGAEPLLALPQLQLQGITVDGTAQRVTLGRVHSQGGQLALALDAQGRPTLLDLLPAPAAPAPPPPATAPWQVALPALDVQDLALALDDASRAQPLRLHVARSSLQGALQWNGQALRAEGLQLALADLSARSADAPPWLRLAELRLSGGAVDSGAHQARVDELRLRAPQLEVRRTATGSLALAQALQPRQPAPAPAAAASASAQPWRWQLARLRLDEGGLRWQDDSLQSPGAALALVALSVALDGLDERTGHALPLRASARVASGGQLSAQGSVRTDGRADLQLRVESLALQAAQPYLAPHTLLTLSEGRASLAGRLRLGPHDARSGAWAFDGRAGLQALQLDEPERSEPFLALVRLEAPRLALRPDHLALGEITLDGLRGRLLIDANKRINLDGVRRPPATDAPPPPTPAASAAPPPRFSLERLRLRDAQLDFADLSLALPFAARIQGLAGEIAGLDSAEGSPPASLQLEGTVAPAGLARASGRLQPLAPTAFSDVRVTFRNIEMTALTPYTATFAGRRIASGTLSLDLDYQLRERQLAGENRIVMERLQLGERVDAPGVTSLPLDLAIALLEDSQGRIELGLPVRGSLDDPQFSYGGLVWKVIVNVLTKVVTSPFRALGALFGGDDALGERLSQIEFDAGSARLTPPQLQKLQQLAQALAQRPGLALQPPAGVAAEADGLALRTRALQARLAALEGRPPGDDDTPQALALALPATQRALATLHTQRFGEAATHSLAEQHTRAATHGQPASLTQRLQSGVQQLTGRTPAPLGPEQIARLRASSLPELHWQALLAAEPLAEGALATLAQARAQAVAQALRAAGLSAERLTEPAPQEATVTAEGLRLRLGVQPRAKGVALTPALPAASR